VKSRRIHNNGFSLIEIMVVLALTSVILYTVALLTQRTVSTLNFLQKKSESIQSATLGCERLCSEIREAITKPSSGGSTSFTKVRPSAPIAIGIVPPPPPPEPPPPPPAIPPAPVSHTWPRVYPSSDIVTVTYSMSGMNLRRQVSGETATVVATDVNSFEVLEVPDTDRTFQVNLAITERRKVQTFSAVVYCPGAPK
jgi:prepilin-type N-terminal cleavage/methylation domain-containing protein